MMIQIAIRGLLMGMCFNWMVAVYRIKKLIYFVGGLKILFNYSILN